MKYVERLVLRALAVPSNTAAELFDPFEQVATWSLDDAATRDASPPVAVPPQAVPIADALASSLPGGGPLPLSSLAEVSSGVVPSAPVARASNPNPEMLARADAVMRAVSPKAVPVERRPSPAVVSAERAAARPRGIRRTESETPDAAAAKHPPRIFPQPPQPLPTPKAVRAALEMPAAGAAAAIPERQRETLSGHPPPVPVPPRRNVIVVASDTRRLHDLAYSSGILRFGLGQS